MLVYVSGIIKFPDTKLMEITVFRYVTLILKSDVIHVCLGTQYIRFNEFCTNGFIMKN